MAAFTSALFIAAKTETNLGGHNGHIKKMWNRYIADYYLDKEDGTRGHNKITQICATCSPITHAFKSLSECTE